MIYLAAGGLLDANPGLLVWTIITFLVVVFILRAFAWNPILHALDERAEKIHGDIEKADKIRKEAEELLATYNAKITAARDEALAIVSEANSDAVKLKAKTVHETQDEKMVFTISQAASAKARPNPTFTKIFFAFVLFACSPPENKSKKPA